MPRAVKIAPRAAEQIRRAAHWWLENRPAAPGAVASDLSEALALLAEQPGIGSLYLGARTPGVRRLLLSRIRYFVYYQADDATLAVLAFWHASRGSGPAV